MGNVEPSCLFYGLTPTAQIEKEDFFQSLLKVPAKKRRRSTYKTVTGDDDSQTHDESNTRANDTP